MRQLGAQDFERAVVAIGTGIEASLLSTGVLIDLGIPEIWAKAITLPHGRILERIGAGHVVYPERDTGKRVAHLISGRLMDYIEFDDGFAIVKMAAPKLAHHKTLAESGLRTKYGVTIVGVKRPGQDFTYAKPETLVRPDDLLIVSGRSDVVDQFALDSNP
jgi:trk system potassium uptake protein